MAAPTLTFESREAFRTWLEANCLSDEGIWLLFGKKGGPKTLTAAQALEEALCFGWIDGQMNSLDDTSYVKYFKQRRKGAVWSEKNIKLVEALEKSGRMTEHGRKKVEEAKADGSFKPRERVQLGDAQLSAFIQMIEGHEPAYANLMAFSPSVQKNYAMSYYALKSEEGKQKRLAEIIERLDLNLNPMQSKQKALEKKPAK